MSFHACPYYVPVILSTVQACVLVLNMRSCTCLQYERVCLPSVLAGARWVAGASVK